ncbi:MAG: DUF6616 family protein [Actinomycetota bacterium]
MSAAGNRPYVADMYHFIEAWTPNDRWAALSTEDRRAFMDGVAGAIAQMAEGGITTLGWGTNDADTPNRMDHQYVAVWQAPSLEAIEALEAGVQASGWYDFFDQVNLRTDLRPASEVMDDHVQA